MQNKVLEVGAKVFSNSRDANYGELLEVLRIDDNFVKVCGQHRGEHFVQIGFLELACICDGCSDYFRCGQIGEDGYCSDCRELKPIYENLAKADYYQIRDNWEGRGYRLYHGDDRFVYQIDGEINGKVYSTIRAAKADCRARFGAEAVRVFD